MSEATEAAFQRGYEESQDENCNLADNPYYGEVLREFWACGFGYARGMINGAVRSAKLSNLAKDWVASKSQR